MSPEDRSLVTTSIANLWTFHTSFMVQIMLALQSEGVLSEPTIARILRRLDADADLLHGDDEKAYAVQALATVHTLLAEWRDAQGPPTEGR